MISYPSWATWSTRLTASCTVAALALTLAVSTASAQDWAGLSPAQAAEGRPETLEGIVLGYDLGWGQLYIDDKGNVVYLNPRAFTNSFKLGQRVRLRGRTAWDGAAVVLTNTAVTFAGDAPLPPAKSTRIDAMADSYGQWIETAGEVRVAEASRDRVTLLLKDKTERCLVYVLQTSGADSFRSLPGCVVRVRGINGSQIDHGRLRNAVLFCPSMDNIVVIQPPATDRWRLPVTSIEDLIARPLGPWTNDPVHVNGLILSYAPAETMAVKDATGALTARVNQITPVSLGQRADVWGFLTLTTNGPVLDDAYFEAAPQAPGPRTGHNQTASSIEPRTIESIREIRQLTRDQANQQRPARVTGVITFADPDWHVIFLQNGRDAIYLDCAQADLRAGQWVEASGETDGSGFAPQLAHCSVKILGATNLPVAVNAELTDAADGHLDARWIEMQGVVHRASWEDGRLSLALVGPEGPFSAIALASNANSADGLIDSLINLRGACGSMANARGQVIGVMLHTPSREQIDVIDAAPRNPFAAAPIPIASVDTFDTRRAAGRRICIEGVVTLAAPGEPWCVEDSSGAIRVALVAPGGVTVGEKLRMVGFPGFAEGAPCLDEAQYLSQGPGALPPARTATASAVLRNGALDGQRVRLVGQVLQSHLGAAQPKLILQDGPIIFSASIVGRSAGVPPREFDPGSVARVEGVCVVQWTDNHEPGAFHVLLSSSDGLALVRGAPWWTFRRAMLFFGGAVFVAALASAWVFLLRRQVKAQTWIIQQKQRELLEASRRAGMAEVAVSVLHNVGNVLNSVNVAAAMVIDMVKSSSVEGMKRAVKMMEERRHDLGAFITTDPRGRNLPIYLERLAGKWQAENVGVLHELRALRKNIDHINEIVARQQAFARVGGLVETVNLADAMEDAVLISVSDLERSGIQLKRLYPAAPVSLTLEKHKLLQILVNLIANAKRACLDSPAKDKEISLRVERAGGRALLSVTDTGVGIPPENLTRIFSFGFTTRPDGHGFGLHSGALAAKEMGGRLTVASEGAGRGARFTLDLPLGGDAP